jgi:ATP-dependent RNA helicase DeaD
VVSERVIALLEARLRGRDRLKAERMERFLSLAHSLAETEDESSLLAMLLDDFYQETFYAPVVPPASEEQPAAVRHQSCGQGREAPRRDQGRPRRGRSQRGRGPRG